ncbi:DsbA family protein [Candidatus Nitrosocosmicus franklandus]|uniref:Disulfide bond formation protein D n=1 Tax=Candidatus Nitrosocosmicus franklandianus TaxID=1798806 RepID=A0A484ICK7_9ARCH|nr:DsbA family protein [Candidatus Nitrosocosmicus franklandus]VFJ13949.1 Disulfide bond formation protein D [Candidatus Nitrosocosmicus franklandus]
MSPKFTIINTTKSIFNNLTKDTQLNNFGRSIKIVFKGAPPYNESIFNFFSVSSSLVIVIFTLSLVSNFTFTDSNQYIVKNIAFAQTPDDNLTLSNLINQGSSYYGNLSSPLVIVDFSDFQCHLCKRYVDNTEQQINSSYVQSGKAVYVFKHLPNRGFDSKNTSLAAQCTNDQGKFWEFHRILYANQGSIDSGWANNENLKKFASQLPNLNITEFNSCFDTRKYETYIDRDISLANSLGFTETPSFIIMNSEGSIIEKIQGPKPFPIFKAVIDNLEKQNTVVN